MKILSTQLHAPVLRQDIAADVHSRGKPTAFEMMAVSLVKTGKGSEELKGQTLSALFEFLIGHDAADLFLGKTLDDLFSPAAAVLGIKSDVPVSSYGDHPVAEIEVLPNGEELLRSGSFPTQARRIPVSLLFDPLAGTVGEEAEGWGEPFPDNPDRALPESLAKDAWPEAEAEKYVRETRLRTGDVLSGVSRQGEGTVGWTTFIAHLELEGETLKASSPHPGAADYLNGLSFADFRRLMVPDLEFIKPTGPVRKLEGVAPSDLFPAGAPPPAPESWIWLHSVAETFPEAPKNVRLEVVWPGEGQMEAGEPSFSVGSDGCPDRLALAAGPYPDASASGDLKAFSHIVTALVFFARMPMEIPLGLREQISGEAVTAMAESLVAALLGTGHPRAFAHAIVLAAEAGLEVTAELREGAESLDGAQRRIVESLCGAWGAAAAARAVLPELEPEPGAGPAPESDRPLVLYSFERDSALLLREYFKGEIPDSRCEFVLTNRTVLAIGKNAHKRYLFPEERDRAQSAFETIRTCGFITFAGVEVRDGVQTRPAETLLDEILRVAAERPGTQRVLVTDNKSIAMQAKVLGVHPMSCTGFFVRLKTNTLSNPIKEK